MIYYPIAVLCYCNSKPSENRRIGYQIGKSNNHFWALVLLEVHPSLSPFQQQGFGTAPGGSSQPGSDTCPAQELSSCQDWVQGNAGFWSSEFRVQIHLCTFILHLFMPKHMSHAGERSGGSEYGDILSYLARNNSYTYFHYISGGFTTKNK